MLQHMSQPISRCRKQRGNLQLVRITRSAAMGQRHRNRTNGRNLTGNHSSNTVGFDSDEDVCQNNGDHDQFSVNMDNFDDGTQGLAVGGDAERGQAVELCPNTPKAYVGGTTFIEGFNAHRHASQRSEVPWYPFAGQKDWEVASWLMQAGLSMSKIDDYLNLEFVRFPSVCVGFT